MSQACTVDYVDHVGVAVRDMEEALAFFHGIFGLQRPEVTDMEDQGVRAALVEIGQTRLELLQPLGADTPVGRFLERRGEGIYLTIYEICGSLAVDARLSSLGVRYTTSRTTANYTNMGFNSIWLHPSAMKGAFTQLSQVLVSDNPWPPAGDSWYKEECA